LEVSTDIADDLHCSALTSHCHIISAEM